jgi:hypothetical protein
MELLIARAFTICQRCPITYANGDAKNSKLAIAEQSRPSRS